MKKLLAVFLVIATILTCTACGGRNNNNTNKEFTLGTLDGQSYQNEFLGMGCLLQNSWSLLDHDVIAAKIPVEEGEVCAMYATASAREVIRLDFRPMTADQLEALDLTQFCKDYLAGLEPFITDENHPIYDSYATPSVSVSGVALTGLTRMVRRDNTTFYFGSFAIKCNGYVARISISTFQEERIEQIMTRFYML